MIPDKSAPIETCSGFGQNECFRPADGRLVGTFNLDIDPVVLSAVIAEIYDAAVDPAKWTRALAAACRWVGGAQANLFWQGVPADQIGGLYFYNDDPQYTELYLKKLAPLNPVFPAVLFQEVGKVMTFHDLVPLAESQETAFHQEWVAPQGFVDSLTVLLERDASRFVFLSFPWRGEAIDITARERLALLVPHFQRAAAIGQLFVQHKDTESALTEALDRIGEAVFLLADDGRVVFANTSARRVIDDGKLLRARHDRISAVAPEAGHALDNSLRAIKSGASIGTQGSTITLEETPGARWIANVLPLRDGARRDVGEAHRASAALFVRHSRFADPTPLEALAKTYRLTASEIRVVEAMLRISGVNAIADALGISQATVKTHLVSVFRKCSVNRQSELIKLVAGLGPARSDQ
ncbi:MAG: LuxR C-terminal-related transcriptional regulator [Xanthobacteraceae bacterium]|nr:LuxR C-terminal-related transcriptional regulator [Xanthobacteraceae bacterium]